LPFFQRHGHTDKEINGDTGKTKTGPQVSDHTQARPRLDLKYLTTVGFTADFGGRGFHLPVDISVRDDGRIFVMSRSSPVATAGMRIGVADLKHKFHGEFGSFGTGEGQFTRPAAIAINGQNHLFVADDSLNRITEFDSRNNYVRHWGETGSKPDPAE
jgi:hypothetical protein